MLNYIRLERSLENIKNGINSGSISKFKVISKVKEALFERYNKKYFEDRLPVKDRKVEKYFSEQNYQGLQVLKVSGGKSSGSLNPFVGVYNEPQDTGSFDEMMIKVQRDILSEWRRSDITKLDELADSLEDLVECKIEVFGTQIICI